MQCTADLLPADVVGTNVFNQREDRFEFRPGPIFANVVLVDEINRASPKTQSGLLECMQERRVTVDVHSHELARPFLVLATQNPVEFEGTYPLPEAQVDRFMARVSLGYPSPAAEVGDAAAPTRPATASRCSTRWPPPPSCSPSRTPPRRVHASDAAARLRRRAAAAHARGPARRARREPARRPHAPARRQGARAAPGPRPRAARRRPVAGRRRALPPHRPRARGGRAPPASGSWPTRWPRRRRSGAARCARPRSRPRSWALALSLVAALFDAEPLYVPGVAFIVLAAGAALWVAAAPAAWRCAER